MLVWLTRFYLSFDAPLIECYKHFHSVWENNCAMSAKQRSTCEDVYRVHDNGKVWPLLNFHELQTEELPDFSLLSKNPLKLNKSKMNQIILIMLCRNGGNSGGSRQNVDRVLSQKNLAKMRFLSIFIQIWKF